MRSVALLALVAGCARRDAPAPPLVAPSGSGGVALVAWEEPFDQEPSGWIAPRGHAAADVAAVYRRTTEAGRTFLDARHDARPAATRAVPAVHWGKRLDPPVPLAEVERLVFSWRVLEHPSTGADPWRDLGASVYVVFRPPSVFSRGRGLKLGWLARADGPPSGQLGIEQVALRVGPAGADWVDEDVDLCAVFRARGGRCEDESVTYVGVLTDADDGRSVAHGSYDGFRLVRRASRVAE